MPIRRMYGGGKRKGGPAISQKGPGIDTADPLGKRGGIISNGPLTRIAAVCAQDQKSPHTKKEVVSERESATILSRAKGARVSNRKLRGESSAKQIGSFVSGQE